MTRLRDLLHLSFVCPYQSGGAGLPSTCRHSNLTSGSGWMCECPFWGPLARLGAEGTKYI